MSWVYDGTNDTQPPLSRVLCPSPLSRILLTNAFPFIDCFFDCIASVLFIFFRLYFLLLSSLVSSSLRQFGILAGQVGSDQVSGRAILLRAKQRMGGQRTTGFYSLYFIFIVTCFSHLG